MKIGVWGMEVLQRSPGVEPQYGPPPPQEGET